MRKSFAFMLVSVAVVASLQLVQAQQPRAMEAPTDMLAAQIRLQGFVCDKAIGARQDIKRSRPDHAVWVLKCSNATYRVSRAPDMAADVKRLR